MSARRREFARFFVESGGNGTKAAVLAGYSVSDPAKAASRALLDVKVVEEIKRLSTVNIGAWLPLAIRVLIDIMSDPTTPARDRISAANSLLDRAGMAAPKGGVQVNVGVQVNGNEVQALIGSIWSAKEARGSDIPLPMSDDARAVEAITSAAPAVDHPGFGGMPIAAGAGGGDFQGPDRRVINIPPSSHAPQKKYDTSVDTYTSDGYVDGSTARGDDDGRPPEGSAAHGVAPRERRGGELVGGDAAHGSSTISGGKAGGGGEDEGHRSALEGSIPERISSASGKNRASASAPSDLAAASRFMVGGSSGVGAGVGRGDDGDDGDDGLFD
jgi:hypothetical protein